MISCFLLRLISSRAGAWSIYSVIALESNEKRFIMRIFLLIAFCPVFLLFSAYGFTVEWTYTEANHYDRMTFGASPVLADLGPDVNSVGGEPDEFLEVVTGSDEYSTYFPELGTTAVGIWRRIDALCNLEWAVNTLTDESRSSVAALDFYEVGDGNIEIVGGTTSGWNVEAMDRMGTFLWTFPSPPATGGPYMWHSSPAVADVVPTVSGLEVVIGNNPCHSVWCLQADPSDGVDDGITYVPTADTSCFTGYPATTGTDGVEWDVLWKFNTSAPVISTPALGDVDGDGDVDVLVGDGYKRTYSPLVDAVGGNLYCIDGPTGTLRWQISTGGSEPVVDASPALADFDGDGDLEVVVGAMDGNLYIIDGDEDASGTITGAEMTTIPMGQPVHSSAAIADVNGDGEYEIIASSNSGVVYCIRYSPPTTTTILWTTALDTAVISSPAIANPSDPYPWTHFCANPRRDNFYPVIGYELDIIVATMGGKIYRLNGSTGEILDSIDIGTHIHTSPVVADMDFDCELEIVVTVCNNPYGATMPDEIYCLGTGIYNPDCMECGDIVAWSLCPIDTVLPVVSCSTQTAVFAYAETTLWDRPNTDYTFGTVMVHHRDGSDVEFTVYGYGDNMYFETLPHDTVEVYIWHNWLHGDSVLVTLDSIITNGSCTSYVAESISFVVDLEPPVISPSPGMPPSGSVVPSGQFVLNFIATDEPAGVLMGVSSMIVKVFHGDGSYDSIFVIGSLVDTILVVDNDSVVVFASACDSIYDYGCSCGPNCATDTFWYLVEGRGPIASPITPPEGVISACDPQGIWIAITDTQGVDSSTIVAVFNGDTFTCTDDELSFSSDTLYFTPPGGFWMDGETVYVELIAADDIYGNTLQNPLLWQFYIDYSPPFAQMTSPQDSGLTYDQRQSVMIEIHDNLAGVLVDSSFVSFGGHRFGLSDVLLQISADSTSGEVFFDPTEWGVVWLPGETVRVVAELCDNPDTCGPNCETYRWFFILPEDFGCARMPNPFTPNGDGKNDYCQFTFPGMGYEDGRISIFDIHNIPICTISVPTGGGAKESARWYGFDDDGNLVPVGLYLYVIEVGGEIVCEGTVTVAR